MAEMWQYEIDPNELPGTPLRNYRLYSEDGSALWEFYSLGNNRYQDGSALVTEKLARRADKTADEVRAEIQKLINAGFASVTLRALSEPAK